MGQYLSVEAWTFGITSLVVYSSYVSYLLLGVCALLDVFVFLVDLSGASESLDGGPHKFDWRKCTQHVQSTSHNRIGNIL